MPSQSHAALERELDKLFWQTLRTYQAASRKGREEQLEELLVDSMSRISDETARLAGASVRGHQIGLKLAG